MYSDKDLPFEYSLPALFVQLLLAMVEIAERNQQMSIVYTWRPRKEEPDTLDLMVWDSKEKKDVVLPYLNPNQMEDCMKNLEILGLVERLHQNGVVLLPATFRLAKHYKRKEQGDLEEEIKHIEELLNIHRENLRKLEIMAARQGMNVNIETQNRIEFEEKGIEQLERKLESLKLGNPR
jgi:hypothetical protein